MARAAIWGLPPIGDDDHLVKIRDCLSRRLPPDRADRLIGLARRAENLTAAEVRAAAGERAMTLVNSPSVFSAAV